MLIEKKEFTAAVLDPKHETFIIYVVILSINSGDEMHPSKRAQITHLKANKASNKVSSKYIDFIDIFLSQLAAELLVHTKINNHTIKLSDDW